MLQQESTKINPEDHIGLVNKIVNKYKHRVPIEEDEIKSIAFEALLGAASSYDPSKAKFSTHACRRMSGAIGNSLRYASKPKYTLYNQVSIHSKVTGNSNGNDKEVLDYIKSDADYTELQVTEFLNTLKDKEKQIISALMTEEGITKVAENFGYSNEGIRKLRNRVKSKYLKHCGREI